LNFKKYINYAAGGPAPSNTFNVTGEQSLLRLSFFVSAFLQTEIVIFPHFFQYSITAVYSIADARRSKLGSSILNI